MSHVVGEVRWFSTGLMISTFAPGHPGVGRAEWEIEQRIWNGEKWALLGDTVSPALREYFERVIKERQG